jgi:hypothetical protein
LDEGSGTIPDPLVVAGLAVLTFGYCLSKAIGDFQQGRRASGCVGAFVGLAAPAAILVASEALT